MKALTIAIVCQLAGCSASVTSVTSVPDLDRVLTVQEFVADAPLRQKVGDFCANNPGQTGLDPNCINVRQAIHIASSGTGNFPRIVPDA